MKNNIFADVPPHRWNDWHWQIENSIADLEGLGAAVTLSDSERDGIGRCLENFRMAVTPYYLSLIDFSDKDDPIKKQCIPSSAELIKAPYEQLDSLAEGKFSPVPGLVHRYPDRVLLLATGLCAMYCRHCTRRRFAGRSDLEPGRAQLEGCIEYIRENSQIRDVLISGGDPLMLSDEALEWLLEQIRAIDNVEIIRMGTRMPVVCPQRITPELCAVLEKYHPLWINTHFNHPDEITPESEKACAMLAKAGIPLGNQSVLLAGVNDDEEVMKKLVHALARIRVRPYYLYACDQSIGLDHFRTSLRRGIEIIEALRGYTSGFCVPQFVVDAPGGGGKIPVDPNYIISENEKETVLRTYNGETAVFTEPLCYKRKNKG